MEEIFDQLRHNAPAHEIIFSLQKLEQLTALTEDGETLLHAAVIRDDFELVEALLNRGADPNMRDHNGLPPLALSKGTGPVYDCLINAGGSELSLDRDTVLRSPGQLPDETDKPNDAIFTVQAIFALITPFVVLLLNNGFYFTIKFTLWSLLFYLIAAGFLISKLTLKPSWYKQVPGRLNPRGLPHTWGNQIFSPKREFGLEYEDIRFPTNSSKFGHGLRGWFVPGSEENTKKTAIVFGHGGGRDRRSWLRHLPLFHRAGYTCFLFDFTGHGISDLPGSGLRYGMRERFDILAAAKYLREARGFDSIAAVGTSMGASSVIMAAALDKSAIDVVVAENPMATIAALQAAHIRRFFRSHGSNSWLTQLLMKAIMRSASIWLNVRIGNKPTKSCQAIHVISKISPRPILLMHGTEDDIVPFTDSLRLYQAADSPKELWIIPGAQHCELLEANPDAYEKRVIHEFLGKYAP